MADSSTKPNLLTQRSYTVSEASNQSEPTSSAAEDEADGLTPSADEQSSYNDDYEEDGTEPSQEEEENDLSNEEVGPSQEVEDAVVVEADPSEEETSDDNAEKPAESDNDENIDPANLSTDAKNVIKMFQKMSNNPNVDNYDYEEDESVFPVEAFPLPFDDMSGFQAVMDSLSLGEKRYVVDYIRSSCETMKAEARRIKGQLRAINARSGRLQKQIQREENAAQKGINPDSVPRSSKGIGKKF